jgi:hypothetical protein
MEVGPDHRTQILLRTPAGLGTSAKNQEEPLFHSLAKLLRFPLVTVDGEKRPIQSVLFDDRSWEIQYVVVEAGNWFASRPVALATKVLEVPSWEDKVVRTGLTSGELPASPAADTVRPVSRQQELAWRRHFGWPDHDPYWRGPVDPALREFEGSSEDDPHLRRTGDLKGYELWGPSRAIGRLEDYLVEEGSWHIGYLLAWSGEWVFREQVLSTLHVCGISWGEHRILMEEATEGVINDLDAELRRRTEQRLEQVLEKATNSSEEA